MGKLVDSTGTNIYLRGGAWRSEDPELKPAVLRRTPGAAGRYWTNVNPRPLLSHFLSKA